MVITDIPRHELAFEAKAGGFRLLLRRNCSISPEGLLRVFAMLALASLGIASVFAALGAWLILPFAGLEVLRLGVAFVAKARRAADCERIDLEDGRSRVQIEESERMARYELDPRQARVRLEKMRGYGARVKLRDARMELEVGRHLDAEARGRADEKTAGLNRERSKMAVMSARKSARPAKAALWAALVVGAGLPGMAAALEWNLQPAASGIAQSIHGLHEYIMLLVTILFVGVFGFMFYSVYAHRKSKGHKAEEFHENTTVEIIWTVIPAIILVVIAWPVTKTVVAQKDTSNPDLTIKVTGYQWKWGYDYIKGEGEGISFISTATTPRDQIEGRAPKGEHYLREVDNEMVVPIGKKVRVLTTAADVIHSWWIPAFGVKQDAMPGFIRDTWFRADTVGTYRGACVELCGKEHGFMPIVVRVVGAQEYTAWVSDQKRKMAATGGDGAADAAKVAHARAPRQ